MSLPPTTAIAHVRLQVRDMERALAFYRDALGLHEITSDGSSAQLSASSSSPMLVELHALPDAVLKPRRSTGLYHVAIRLPSRAALARVLYRLVALGVRFQGASDHGVSEALYLADPDGSGLELYRDRPREQWRMDGGQVAMSTEPLDVEALLREGEHAFETWTGIDPATDIGHVHLHVAHLDQAEAFYCDRLGFDVMQRSYPGALFVSAGGYHHHLGLNIWAGEGAPPPPANAVGLRALAVRIAETDAWEAAVTRLAQAGAVTRTTADGFAIASTATADGPILELVRPLEAAKG